jgi:hypothetical protein
MNTDMKRIPVRYVWVGGKRAGHSILDFRGREICRVCTESDARFAMRYECTRPGSLVDEVHEEKVFWRNLARQ